MRKNSTKAKRAALAALLAAFVLLLAGCSGDNAPKPVELSKADEMQDGYYVLKQEDETAYPITSVSQFSSSQGLVQNTMQGAKTCFFVNETIMDSVPKLEEGDLFIVKSSSALDDVITYFPLQDYGYTLGAVLSRTDDPSLYGIRSDQDFDADSDIYAAFSNAADNLSEVRISNIGDQPVTEKMLSEFYTVKDLQRDSEYDIVFYEGTNTKTFTAKADTDLLVSDPTKIMRITDKTMADQGFAILKLDSATEEGYYYVPNLESDSSGCIFQFVKGNADNDETVESYEGITTENDVEAPPESAEPEIPENESRE